jgi:hypothetical protein
MPLRPLPVLAHSITKLGTDAVDAVIVCGSHGGVYSGYLAAKSAVRAVILNDAGVGKDAAGIGALAYLEELDIAAACAAHSSCRIGDAHDMMARGIVSHANALATAVGVREGQSCAAAAAHLTLATYRRVNAPPAVEARNILRLENSHRALVLIDSASLVQPEDVNQIVVTGSHGGLINGQSHMALQVEAFLAVFNDAGVGIDGCGRTRLPALDARKMAAITVAHTSARIGDALSTYREGIISATNNTALELGAKVGSSAADFLQAVASVPAFTPTPTFAKWRY